MLDPADDTTEVCGVRLLGKTHLDIINIYRPPIRPGAADERQDHFDPDRLPNDSKSIIVGDLNAHHPLWDAGCDAADDVGERLSAWLDRIGWTTLNSGEPTHTSYSSGGHSAPDLAACGAALAPRVTWSLGPDLGSDHLPMLLDVRGSEHCAQVARKTRWSFAKADWLAFEDACEAAFPEAEPARTSAQELATHLTDTIRRASIAHVPRGSRKDARPWALDPVLQEAVRERREARRQLRAGAPGSKERWVAAKQRASEVERATSQAHFRKFVEEELDKPASLGRTTRILKKWEGADDHRAGEAMVTEDGRLLASDLEKAEAFNRTYAHVARQVRVPKVDRGAKRKLADPVHHRCSDCGGEREEVLCPLLGGGAEPPASTVQPEEGAGPGRGVC